MTIPEHDRVREKGSEPVTPTKDPSPCQPEENKKDSFMKESQAKKLVNENYIPHYNPHWYAKGYLEAIGKAERIFQKIADSVSDDDPIVLNDALEQWEKEK